MDKVPPPPKKKREGRVCALSLLSAHDDLVVQALVWLRGFRAIQFGVVLVWCFIRMF